MKSIVCTCIFLVCIVPAAMAGTAVMNFEHGVGLLTWGSGTLTASGGRAVFTGYGNAMLANGETLISSGGTVSATMTLRPSTDAASGVGILMYSVQDDSNVLSAICTGDGYVTFTDYIGLYRTASFSGPAANGNYFTVSYSASTGRATLTLNGSSSVFLEDALAGASSVYSGVGAFGPAGFDSFSATGSGIPDYPPTDSDDDGVSDDDETAAGTDPDDPGSRPVVKGAAATVTGLDGTVVVFGPNAFEEETVNVGVAEPSSIPAGAVPGGMSLSGAGVELTTNGTFQPNPVSVTTPYTLAEMGNLDPATLTVFFYNGGAYSSDGIADVSVNTTARTVSFTTTHFTLFVVGGDLTDSDDDGTPDIEDAFPGNPNGQTDSDADGIGDEWETLWFGNLTTADETTDSDGDGVSDVQEFDAFWFNFDPTDGVSELPAAGLAGLAAAALSIAALASRRGRTRR